MEWASDVGEDDDEEEELASDDSLHEFVASGSDVSMEEVFTDTDTEEEFTDTEESSDSEWEREVWGDDDPSYNLPIRGTPPVSLVRQGVVPTPPHLPEDTQYTGNVPTHPTRDIP